MTTISRRHFLATAAATAAATRLGAQSPTGAQVTLTLPAEATGPHMPADFVGLSYEVQQLVDPAFFSLKNTGLIREFKALSTTRRVAAWRQHQRVRLLAAHASFSRT